VRQAYGLQFYHEARSSSLPVILFCDSTVVGFALGVCRG
jgi:hypothetical protein